MNLDTFLNKPFEEVSKLDISEINSLYGELRTLHFNARKDPELIARLIGSTSYYHGLVGMKLSQAVCCKRSIQRELEIRIYKESTNRKKDGSKITQKDVKHSDVECFDLQKKLDLMEAVCEYLKNIRESLFLEHYSLRNNSSNSRGTRIDEHKFDNPGARNA